MEAQEEIKYYFTTTYTVCNTFMQHNRIYYTKKWAGTEK